ncbi:murein transglycosylase A [Chlorogloea sp. CCALA 695]|uniref:murein transglycosylase A n=1 Tax=Chlorogloea sp. CCALA 695 TaxID=2107693 RepID=UPI000D067440|nr:MltA domain-containing protein [Chlorogloea sp. CCALA 695]PSB31423.1 murein transglycosylase [Chlorogloea sp. CCALA 695]
MKRIISLLTSVGIAIALAPIPANAGVLQATKAHQQTQNDNLGLDEQIWGENGVEGDWKEVLKSVDSSLRYVNSPGALKAYRKYSASGITRDRVRRSLVHFRKLVITAKTPADLQQAVKRDFVFYRSTGRNGKGEVLFTAYYEPMYEASRFKTEKYRFPLYQMPSNFKKWSKPHPTRAQLEGRDGLLGVKSKLKGLELVWLSDRLEAFLAQIQGSARFNLTDGTQMSIGYAAKTDYPYTSIGKELAKDGKLPLPGLTLPVMINYFTQKPWELSSYLPRNRSFVFFRKTYGAPATGSLGIPVTAERSIATDKALMPPGALALIHTSLPFAEYSTALFKNNSPTTMQYRNVSRYVLDQDAGSAIKGAGRVDYFMGTGKLAGDRAGVTGSRGHLYYLLLK